MKKVLILLFLAFLGQSNAQAQSPLTDTVIHLYIMDAAALTGVVSNPGGTVTPHFANPAINAITDLYTFTSFELAYPSSSYDYLRHYYKVVSNSTTVAAQLKASFPDIFPDYDISGPAVLLGVNDAAFASGYTVGATLYPNPASGVLSIDSATSVHITGITAIDISGRRLVINKQSADRQFPVSTLPNGIYCFRLSFDDRPASVEKILILNSGH